MTIDPRHKILSLYAVYSFAILMGCLPNMDAQNISAITTILLLIAAYVFESKHTPDSLETHHAIFVIRTIWIWSTFLLLGIIGAGFIVATKGDMSTIDQFMDGINNGVVPTEDDINALTQSYFESNATLIIKTALVCLGPAQIYASWRIIRGAMRAFKGYRIQNFRSWL